MPKNKSEKKTIKLSKNSFLNMYVFNNPNKKYAPSKESDEFCDCLIHMANLDIVIQIKQNNEPNSKNWFQRKILGDARRQLTISCAALLSPNFEIWDRENKVCLSNTPKDPSTVFPLIVFEKGDLCRYQQVAKAEKPSDTCPGYVNCNIFSMEDFEYATSMIPTGKDFIEYLIFRFNELKELTPGIQLYPVFQKGDEFLFAKNVSSNEQILVSKFLHLKFDNPEKALINSKMWHDNLSRLETDMANNVLLQLLSYLSMEDICKWDIMYKRLIVESKKQHYVWNPEPILTGFVDGNKCGIILSYSPISVILNHQTDGDKEIKEDALIAIHKYNLSCLFIFQYTDSKTVRLTKVIT